MNNAEELYWTIIGFCAPIVIKMLANILIIDMSCHIIHQSCPLILTPWISRYATL
jgi:hypothetical protein